MFFSVRTACALAAVAIRDRVRAEAERMAFMGFSGRDAVESTVGEL
jgi:hypothetical protein